MLLNRTPKDYDIATNASPGQIMLHFPHTLDIGKAFGVIQVLLEGSSCEVATFRRDCSYEDGRRPSTVEFCDAREDVLRRDFTINGLLYDPEKSEVIDYVEGQKDLAARVLRTIGGPSCVAKNRFSLPEQLPLSWPAFMAAFTNPAQTNVEN